MLSKLQKIKQKSKKRLGRGESSGKGKTSGRGTKGQKSREKIKLSFEGGQLPLIKRLPFKRGVGNKPKNPKFTVTLDMLERLPKNSLVTAETLKKAGMLDINKKRVKLKVVFKGTITKPLKLKIPATARAKEAIIKAKGEVADV